MISNIIARMGITHLLDYGCGEGAELAYALKVTQKLTYQAYDPTVPKFSKAPLPAQMVVGLEIGHEQLDEIAKLTEGVAFITFDTSVLPLIGWLANVCDRWDLQTVQQLSEGEYFVIGTCKTLIENQAGEKIA
jgi:hypothetical protein